MSTDILNSLTLEEKGSDKEAISKGFTAGAVEFITKGHWSKDGVVTYHP